MAAGLGWGPLWGCKCMVKNVCRKHGLLTASEGRRLDARLAHINSWMRSVDRPAADKGNSFAWLEAANRGAGGNPLDRICLLTDLIFKPVAQLLTICHLRDDDSERPCFEVPAPSLRLRTDASASSSRFRGSR